MDTISVATRDESASSLSLRTRHLSGYLNHEYKNRFDDSAFMPNAFSVVPGRKTPVLFYYEVFVHTMGVESATEILVYRRLSEINRAQNNLTIYLPLSGHSDLCEVETIGIRRVK